jgi:hypothetical protein
MYKLILTAGLIVVALVAYTGCDRSADSVAGNSTSADDAFVAAMASFPPQQTPPPPGLVTVSIGSASLEFWPYTGENFSGQGQDPINLIFHGNVDPLKVREALMSLDGNRTAFGFPDEFPFNARWTDAIGNVQVGYGSNTGWTGGVVQLACGDYHIARFHIRLFKLGDWTVGNAHFEILIPGTSDHQVLNWELAEQFVIADFVRSGLLDASVPMVPTQQINPSPYMTIPAILYNELPVELRAAIGGPLGDVTEDVPRGTDGHAMILNVAGDITPQPGIWQEVAVSHFDIVTVKPFCETSEYDYVHLGGDVDLNQVTELTADGQYIVTFRAEGQLAVTPIDPTYGTPAGEPMKALAREHHDGYISGNVIHASSLLDQKLLPPSVEGAGRLFMRLKVSSNGANGFQVINQCGDNPVETSSAEGAVPLIRVRGRLILSSQSNSQRQIESCSCWSRLLCFVRKVSAVRPLSG